VEQPTYCELPLSRRGGIPANRAEARPWQAKTNSKVQIVEFPKRIEKQCGQYPAILKNEYLSF